MDVSEAIRPGERNQVTLRVLCNAEVFGANGIYYRMFLYAREANPIERMKGPGAPAAPVIEGATDSRIQIGSIEDAVDYHVWASPSEDGRGARMLVRNPRPPDNIPPLPAGELTYLFASYTDRWGAISTPSPPYPVDLREKPEER